MERVQDEVFDGAVSGALARRLGLAPWRYDVESRSLMWSDAARVLFGAGPDASCSSLERGIESGSRSALDDQLERAVNEGEPVDVQLGVKEGLAQTCWLRVVGEPVRRDGRVVAVEGYVQDQTRLVHALAIEPPDGGP